MGRESEYSVSMGDAAMQHRTWRSFAALSRGLQRFERFLAGAAFDRAPWAAVAFAGGIAAWFALAGPWQWLALLAACGAVAAAGLAGLPSHGDFPYTRQALVIIPLMLATGCLVVWGKSAIVGRPAIERPMVTTLTATVLSREERPAEMRRRLVLATREPGTGRAIRIRLNVPLRPGEPDNAEGLGAGATVRVRARLMPPAPPMLPGAYDFARAAWFDGLSATGSALGPVEVIVPSPRARWLDGAKARLSAHIRAQVAGSAGGIAAALATGDRGGIGEDDARAMRDSGLAHLLSISGLHVSAVIGAAYVIAMRLLALWPWLALRVRLPLLASATGAAAGIGYTLLTGSEVPTVRSCVGAVLVLGALALGREALSMRMLAVAAFLVMALWPEAVVGPSFQMSFAAVIAIVALHGAEPVRRFLAPREESWLHRNLRHLAMLLLTGIVIELALMPIGLFHFHRAGIYGAFANVIAIPLTTIVAMPLVAIALVLDLAGASAPIWWLTGHAIDAMLAMARWVAGRPGAVTLLPAMGRVPIALCVAGCLWLGLWHGKPRLLGLLPTALGGLLLVLVEPPDLLISGDGRHVGLFLPADGTLLVLREGRAGYASETLAELSGMAGETRALAAWPGAQCSPDFCALAVNRSGRTWHFLIGRGRDRVPERALAAACERSDIVIAERWLPRSCRPRLLKADRALLGRTGGLAIDLSDRTITTVAQGQGRHGWWRPAPERVRRAGPAGGEARPPASAPASGSSAVSGIATRPPAIDARP